MPKYELDRICTEKKNRNATSIIHPTKILINEYVDISFPINVSVDFALHLFHRHLNKASTH